MRSTLLGGLLTVWILLISATPATATPLILGSVDNEPAKEIRLFSPLVHYLARQLAPQGITKGRVVVAATMEQMAALLQNGRVDFYMDSPMPSIVVNQHAGSVMVLRRWKKGVAEYHSVLFVNRESPIQTLTDLTGKRVGFEDKFSSSGHILPRIALMEAKLDMVQLPNFRTKVPPGKVGYVFNNDDESTMVRVLMGRLAAGAMSAKTFKQLAKGDIDRLRILHETFPIPRHIVNLRGDFPANLKEPLIRALQAMEHTEEGQAILKAFQKTVRFDPIPPQTQTRMQAITPIVLNILNLQPAPQ